jgi:hypothetical protein
MCYGEEKMTELCKCSGEGCSQKENRLRYTALEEPLQPYFMVPPGKYYICGYFVSNSGEEDKDEYLVKVTKP